MASAHALGSTNPQYSTNPWTNHPHYPRTSSQQQQQQQQQQDPTTMAGTAAIGITSQDHNAKTSMLQKHHKKILSPSGSSAGNGLSIMNELLPIEGLVDPIMGQRLSNNKKEHLAKSLQVLPFLPCIKGNALLPRY